MARWKTLSFAVLVVMFSSLVAPAQQADRGTITGIVTDPSGAVIPGAKVAAQDVATGTESSTVTNAAGSYTVPFLQQGGYTLTVGASGFRTYVQSGIVVSVGTTLKVNVALQVGQSVQKVEVTGEAPILHASSSDLGTVLSNKTYSNLPLAVSGGRRDPTAFIFLAPGVTGNSFLGQINGGESFTKEIWVGGAPTAPMELQGDSRSIQNAMSVDAINEFKLSTNNYGAELGHGSGIMSYTLKAGTNKFHGTAYEYLRNTVTDSRGFFASKVPKDIQNEFGANIGGPVIIPKLYNGRDRTFFFFDFNAYRHTFGAPGGLTTVPTAQMLSGDFRGITPIYDPATTRTVNGAVIRDRFTCNGVVDVICPDRFSAVSKNFFPLIPAPELPGLFNNFRNVIPGGKPFFHETAFTVRIDHSISDRHSITGSWQHGTNLSSGGNPFGLPGPLASIRPGPASETLVRFSDTFAFRSNLVNHFTFGYNRDPQATVDVNKGTDWPGKLGLTGVSSLIKTMPSVSFATNAFAPWAQRDNSEGYNIVPNSYVYEEQLLWTKGRHTLTFGTDIRFQGENFSVDSSSGEFNFSNLTTGLPGVANTGNSFASFLLGAVSSADIRLRAFGVTGDRVRYMAYYGQDSIKFSPKLTVQLGLRWEVPYGDTEIHNIQSTLDPNLPNPGAGNILGALSFQGYGPGKCNCTRFINTDYKEFSPHFGLAYQLDSKTVFRGGYGIFYTGGGPLGGGAQRGNATGWSANPVALSPDGGITPAFNWDGGFPQNFVPPPRLVSTFANGGGIGWIVRNMGRAPYIQNWNIDLEREVTPSFMLSAAYAGSKGTRLPTGIFNPDQTPSKYLSLGNLLGANINSPQAQAAIAAGTIPGPPYAGFNGTVSQSLRPFPQYAGIGVLNPFLGNSTYHALQVKATKRFSQGLSFLVSYTTSKTLDDSGSLFGGFFGSSGRDNGNRRIEKSLSVNDIPQNLVMSYVYELPFGSGKKFLNRGGAIGKLAGGWQVSGINIYHSGGPMQIGVNNTLNIFNEGNRPNRVPGVSPRSNVSLGSVNVFAPTGPASYINPLAFSQPAPFTFGNGPRTYGDLRQPAFYNEDFALTKRTYFTESANVEFKWEMFNLFNRHIFGIGGTNFSDLGSFGRQYGQANGPRQMQFSLRINF